jgi:predicted CXXCH cytochrome family protein
MDRGCLNCHAGHGSNLPRLLARPLLDSCLECHDRPVPDRNGGELPDFAELLHDNPYYHGPVRRADCSSCHEPHASPNFRLLRKLYPREFYLPDFDIERYDLCFQCHFKELVLVERGPGITRFRHGDVNLHYRHVNREKSRTCRACHAVHASKKPAHLVETFTFGEWKEAPLGYEKLPGGGSCAPACHRKVAYIRGSKEPVPAVK